MNDLIRSILYSYMGIDRVGAINISKNDYQILKYHKINLLLYSIKDKIILGKDEFNDVILNVENTKIKNEFYVNELMRISDLFDSNKIDYVVLKGCSCILSNYTNIYDRIFKDIDLLVYPEDIEVIEDILFKNGYVYGDLLDDAIVPAKRKEIIYKRLKTHEIYNMIKKHSNDMFTKLDINFKFMWQEFENVDYPIEYVFMNRSSRKYNNHQISTLNPDYFFIHSAVHFYNEAFYFTFDIDEKHYNDPHELRLFRLVDIILTINRNDIDVYNIYKLSVTLKCVHKIEFALSLILLLLDKDYIKEFYKYFNITENAPNYFYSKSGIVFDWPISIEERLFDLEKRKEASEMLLKRGAFL